MAVAEAEGLSYEILECPAVAHVFDCDCYFNYSPELDILVRLVSAEQDGDTFDEGRVLRALPRDGFSADSIAAARELVEKCVSALCDSGESYAIITHVHGDATPDFRFGGQTWEEAITILKHSVGDAVMHEY